MEFVWAAGGCSTRMQRPGFSQASASGTYEDERVEIRSLREGGNSGQNSRGSEFGRGPRRDHPAVSRQQMTSRAIKQNKACARDVTRGRTGGTTSAHAIGVVRLSAASATRLAIQRYRTCQL